MPSFHFNLLLSLTLLVNHFERCDEFRCDLFPLSKFYWLLKLSARRFEICNVLCLSRREPSRYRYSTLRHPMAFKGKSR